MNNPVIYLIPLIGIIALVFTVYRSNRIRKHSSPLVAFSFMMGAVSSGLAGFIGLRIATKANVRTTQAAQSSLNKALKIAFAGGSVMGLAVVGLGILGLSLWFIF